MGNRVFLTTASIVGLLLILRYIRYTKIDQDMMFYLSNVFLNNMQKNIQTIITANCTKSERDTLADIITQDINGICIKLEPNLKIPKKELEGFFVFLREYYNLSLPLDEKERQINKLVEYMMRNSQKQLQKTIFILKLEIREMAVG